MSTTRQSPGHLARTKAAAVSIGAISAAYAMLGVWYFYADFFRFLGRGMPTAVLGTSYAVRVNCNAITLLSPWRIALFVAAVLMLGLSAWRLWKGKEGARALALLSLWGVLLPQVLWFTELSVDWFGGRGIGTILLAGWMLVAMPTMLIYEGRHTLLDWHRLRAGRTRLLATAITATWVAFAATEFLDHSIQLDSSTAPLAAMLALVLSFASVVGLFKLRVWGLLLAVAGALSMAVVPLTFLSAHYTPSYGYIDVFVHGTTGTTFNAIGTAMFPVTAVLLIAGPFLHSLVARLRN